MWKFLLFLFLIAEFVTGICTKRDYQIYKRKGTTFPKLFRSFGGLTVSREDYLDKIVKQVGLSKKCAACYSDAYICGWDNCFWACKEEGNDCDTCLVEKECIQKCKTCTGFL